MKTESRNEKGYLQDEVRLCGTALGGDSLVRLSGLAATGGGGVMTSHSSGEFDTDEWCEGVESTGGDW